MLRAPFFAGRKNGDRTQGSCGLGAQRAAPLHDRDVGAISLDHKKVKDAGRGAGATGGAAHSGSVIAPLTRKVWPMPEAVVWGWPPPM
jgi:hypothetical protein